MGLVDKSYDAMYAATSALRARSLSANSSASAASCYFTDLWRLHEQKKRGCSPLLLLVESPKVSKITADCTRRLLTDVLFTRRCRWQGLPGVSATCRCQPHLHACKKSPPKKQAGSCIATRPNMRGNPTAHRTQPSLPASQTLAPCARQPGFRATQALLFAPKSALYWSRHALGETKLFSILCAHNARV